MTKDRKHLLIELRRQQEIEGFKPETAFLVKLLNTLTSTNEWAAATTVEFHQWGDMSYQTYRFYRPSNLLNSVLQLLEPEIDLF